MILSQPSIKKITIVYERSRAAKPLGVVYFGDMGISNTLPSGGVVFHQ